MFKISRKMMVIAAMAIVLLVTGILNWKYIAKNKDSEQASNTENTQQGEVATASFFSTYKTERNSNRQEEITYLESVISNSNTDKETLAEAQQMKMDIVSNMELENTVEGLLVAKGFEDAVVTFGSSSINIVVKDNELTQAKVAQILDIVTTETKYTAAEVKVIPAT